MTGSRQRTASSLKAGWKKSAEHDELDEALTPGECFVMMSRERPVSEPMMPSHLLCFAVPGIDTTDYRSWLAATALVWLGVLVGWAWGARHSRRLDRELHQVAAAHQQLHQRATEIYQEQQHYFNALHSLPGFGIVMSESRPDHCLSAPPKELVNDPVTRAFLSDARHSFATKPPNSFRCFRTASPASHLVVAGIGPLIAGTKQRIALLFPIVDEEVSLRNDAVRANSRFLEIHEAVRVLMFEWKKQWPLQCQLVEADRHGGTNKPVDLQDIFADPDRVQRWLRGIVQGRKGPEKLKVKPGIMRGSGVRIVRATGTLNRQNDAVRVVLVDRTAAVKIAKKLRRARRVHRKLAKGKLTGEPTMAELGLYVHEIRNLVIPKPHGIAPAELTPAQRAIQMTLDWIEFRKSPESSMTASTVEQAMDMAANTARGAFGLEVEVRWQVPPKGIAPVTPEVATLIRATVTELLMNVAKHAEPPAGADQKAVVSVEGNDRELRVRVSDNGTRFKIPKTRGSGLSRLEDVLRIAGMRLEWPKAGDAPKESAVTLSCPLIIDPS